MPTATTWKWQDQGSRPDGPAADGPLPLSSLVWRVGQRAGSSLERVAVISPLSCGWETFPQTLAGPRFMLGPGTVTGQLGAWGTETSLPSVGVFSPGWGGQGCGKWLAVMKCDPSETCVSTPGTFLFYYPTETQPVFPSVGFPQALAQHLSLTEPVGFPVSHPPWPGRAGAPGARALRAREPGKASSSPTLLSSPDS